MLRWTVALCALGLMVAGAGNASAQGQPPIQSPQDKACRDEATRRVMSEPGGGGDPYVRGRQIWSACMARSQVKAAPTRKARVKKARGRGRR